MSTAKVFQIQNFIVMNSFPILEPKKYLIHKKNQILFTKIRELTVVVTTLITDELCLIHRDLKFTSHKNFCNRILTIQVIFLGYGESKKGCLNSGRNRSAHIFFSIFEKYKCIFKSSLYQNGKIPSLKYAEF